MLSEINTHPRDNLIKFYSNGHRYEILSDLKSKYISVTTWAHSHFPKFNADDIIQKMMNGKNWNPQNKYWGMTPEQIKDIWKKAGQNSCTFGTNLHEQIENFMNCPQINPRYTNIDLLNYKQVTNDQVTSEQATNEQATSEQATVNQTIEWQYFINFMNSKPDLRPYRTEWMIFDEELKIAGSIDMVFENPDGTLSIYDWKRCKEINPNNDWNKFATNKIISHIPDTNYWQYALQLNIYKAILERKYNKQIKDLYLVKLHPEDANNNYELIELPILTTEIENLFQERLYNIN